MRASISAVVLSLCAASVLALPSVSPQIKLEARTHSHPHPHPRHSVDEFFVDGKHIPGVPFAVTDSYAGLLPITSSPKEDREFFFWWYPSESQVGDDSLVIWLNGGPGCSSLEGLLQENGPFLLPWNTTDVVKNPYSWHKLSNVLWVEQPVSVGLGTGTPDITNESQLASEFYGFLEQFFKTFPKLKGKKLYITGESYAGMYIPYISHHIMTKVSAATNKKNGINFQGISINDPSWISDTLSEELPALEFAEHYQKELQLNASTINKMRKMAIDNGVLNYVAKNLNYPPKGPLELPKNYSFDTFDPFGTMVNAAGDANPCFNIYSIDPIYHCPSVTDALGYPPDATDASPRNFVNDQAGFKEYIHANPEKTWLECVNGVFKGKGDTSKPPLDAGIMQQIVENAPSKRTIIQHGVLDAILLANGSALGIQNMTFNGHRGFQTRPSRQIMIDGKPKGLVHTERGLTFLMAADSGHMIPQDQPATAYKMLQYLLGQISASDLSK